MTTLHQTTIVGLGGVEHAYFAEPLPFDESFDLGLEIAAMVGGQLGEAFSTLLQGGNLESKLDEELDPKALARSLLALPDRLLQRGGSKLLVRLLATTSRAVEVDGPRGRKLTRMSLADEEVRTAVYSAGNQLEALRAAKWAFEVNYGPLLTELLAVFKPLLGAARSWWNSFGQKEEMEEPERPESEPERPEREPNSKTGIET